MQYSYRITKYRYLSASGGLRSGPSEWTSFADFDGASTADLQEYLQTESEYVSLLVLLCKAFLVEALSIHGLEKSADTDDDIQEGMLVSIENIPEVVRSILREKYWCRLRSKDIEFHFGYDYYMYCVSSSDASGYILNSGTRLFTQEYMSPYIVAAD